MSPSVRLALLAVLALPGQALAATFQVTNTDDSGSGSLRAAIASANSAGGADTITFSVSGTHQVGAELEITDEVTITGNGTVLNGGGAGRVFALTANDTATITGLRITNGQASSACSGNDNGGSAIATASGSTLTLNQVLIDGNTVSGTAGCGGAVRTQSGTLNVNDSTIRDNTAAASTDDVDGGGIAVYGGTLNLQRSTVSGNSVDAGENGAGGGIYLSGTASITNSTISGNQVGSAGGGAIRMDTGSLTVLSSTITGNDATGGSGVWGGGGLLITGGTVTIRNSIVSGNVERPGTTSNCVANGGTITPLTGNVENGTTCGFGAAKNPLLSGLGSFGGPTSTFIPQLGGDALNAVSDCSGVAVDQRGVSRPQNGACDAGAFELRQPTATTAPASGIGAAAATLNGTVSNPEAMAMVTDFQYGTTTSYGSTTSPQGNVAASGSLSPAVGITGLQPGTTYHFRIVASGPMGTVYGADQTFTTASASAPDGTQPGGTEIPAATGGTPTVLVLDGKPLFDGSGVGIDVGVPGPGSLTGTLTLLGKTNRAAAAAKKKKPKPVVLGKAAVSVTAAGEVRLTVPLNAAAKNRLKGGRKIKAKLTVTFTPASGGKRSSKSTTVTLQRKKP